MNARNYMIINYTELVLQLEYCMTCIDAPLQKNVKEWSGFLRFVFIWIISPLKFSLVRVPKD